MDIQKLVEANKWWITKEVNPALAGVQREEYALLLKSINIREVTIITGVRRCGKSTLMYQMVQHLLRNGVQPEQILFVDLESSKLKEDSLDDIYSTYRQRMNPDKKAYIFLDEVHRREKWEEWVRSHYDLNSDCKFVVSGSCSYLLKKEYATLLTGRNLTFEVCPLSFREFLSFRGNLPSKALLSKGIVAEKEINLIANALSQYLAAGGFPDIFFKESEFKEKVLAQYFDDILYKDILSRHDLNSRKTRDLALYLMANFTCTVSLRNLRNTLGLSYESIKDYIACYNEAFLLFPLEHFSYSLKEQKTRPSKIYCIDNGMRNAVSFKFSKDEGKLAENAVFLALRTMRRDTYYWKGEGEVDFVVKNSDQTLSAINVSYSDEMHERETNGLIEFKSQFKKTKELILITKNIEKCESGISFIPLWKWLLQHNPQP